MRSARFAFLPVVALIAAWSCPARAQPTSPEGAEPVINFSADQVQYDDQLGIVTASGNVEVQYGDRWMFADSISYNRGQDVVSATGNVILLEPTGEVTFAEYAEVTGDLKNGIAQDLRLILTDRSRIAANGARLTGGTVSEFAKAVYSPCETCRADPERPPLWQVKAVRVVHDKERKEIEYKDAWLELAGIPVAYTPYLAHPDPTVKRRTGVLAPSFGASSSLGYFLSVPYYIAVDPQTDVTLTPMITTSEGPVLSGEHRQRFMHGRVRTMASITRDSEDEVQGHIDSEGRFDFTRTWRGGFDVERTSDDTYLRRYRFGNSSTTLTSRAFAEGFRRRSYARIEGLAFQNLRGDVADSEETPFVLPWASYSHVGEPGRMGGYTTLDANAFSLTRYGDARETRRASAIAGWHLPFTGAIGDLYTLSATFQTDLYNTDRHALPDGATYDGTTARAFPQIALKWSYPWMRSGERVDQVVEPIVQLIAAPHGSNPDKIPNEDSLDLEFDDTSLFSFNRFSGTDRIESGPRANYGIRWSAHGHNGGSVSALVGQSYRLRTDDSLPEGSGLEDNLSDYVAMLQVHPLRNFVLDYRTRIDKDDFAARRNEVSASGGTNVLSASLGYAFFDALEASEFPEREQISLGLSARLTRYWRTTLAATHELTQANSGWRTIGGRVTYEDECFAFGTEVRRDFYEDREIKPDTVVLFTVSFKTLGDFQF